MKIFLTLTFLCLFFTDAYTQCNTTVTYGNKTYNTIQIGNQCWFKENLNIGTMINGRTSQSNNNIIEKYCYNNLESNCSIFGGLYQWDEIMGYIKTEGTQGICPNGWHIPTKAEYNQLVEYLGGINVSGGKIKEIGSGKGTHWAPPNGGATNSSNFTAIGSGLRWQNGSFYYYYNDFNMWTSTTVPYDPKNPSEPAYYGGATYGGEWGLSGQFYKTVGLSVRCLKN